MKLLRPTPDGRSSLRTAAHRLGRVSLWAALAAAATPAFADIASADVVRDGSTLHVRWQADGPVDAFVATRPDAPIAERRLVSAADADGQLDLPAGEGRAYIWLKAKDDAAWTAERAIPLSGGSNFRDLGGYRTEDGHRVKWGLLYRSAAMNNLTDGDVAQLSALGVRTVCDLRSRQEQLLAPDRVPPVKTLSWEYQADALFERLSTATDAKSFQAAADALYGDFPTLLHEHLKQVFRSLVDGEAPLVVHCSAGQDRTGLVSGLILAALGVPRETIYRDYLLSTSLRRGANEKPTADLVAARDTNSFARFVLSQQAAAASGHALQLPKPLLTADGRPQLALAFEAIESRESSIDHYLECQLNVGEPERAILRQRYLE